MKKAIVLLLVGLSVASCTQTEKGAGIGAVSGAIIGGAVTGNVRGAAVGAAIGGVSGAVIGSGAEQPGQCYYRERYGRRYIDSCPTDHGPHRRCNSGKPRIPSGPGLCRLRIVFSHMVMAKPLHALGRHACGLACGRRALPVAMF